MKNYLMLIFSLIFSLNSFAANTLQIGQSARIQNVSASYSALKDDDIVNVDAASAARTVTLPPIASTKGKTLMVVKSDSSANTVSVTGFSGTFIINCGQCFVEAMNTGSAWIVKSARNSPTHQTFTTGSGTYNRPFGVIYLRIKMVGSGGGGQGGGASPSTGAVGGSTTFGSSLLIAGGGGVGSGTTANGGGGGSYTINPPAVGIGVFGGEGESGCAHSASGVRCIGGMGGQAPYFGGGSGVTNYTTNGGNGQFNTGAGGQGGGTNAAGGVISGAGGGSGAFIDATIPNPAATYPWAIGAIGTGGATVTTAGGNGAQGRIEVDEHYQ